MAYNQTQLITAVLQELMVVGQGETPSTADSAIVESLLPGIKADLATRRVVTISDMNAVADTLYADLIKLVAEHVAPRFGRPTNPKSLEAFEARLRQLTRLDRDAGDLTVAVLERLQSVGAETAAIDADAVDDAIPQVLADLTAQRIIEIANEAAITDAQFPSLVTLVAARVVPAAIAAELVQAAEGRLADLARRTRSATLTLTQAILQQLIIWGAATTVVDAEAVEGSIQSFLDNLAARNVITINSEDDVDTASWQPLVRYIAGALSPKAPAGAIAQAEGELRTLARIGRGTGAKLKVDAALKPSRFRRLF